MAFSRNEFIEGRLVQSFFSFIYAVFNHWICLMSGTAFIILIGVFEHHKCKQVTWKIYFFVMLLLLFYASFLAWEDKNGQTLTLSKELQDMKIEIKNITEIIHPVPFHSYKLYSYYGHLSC